MSATRTRTTQYRPGFTRLACDVTDCQVHIDGDDAATCRKVGRDLGWSRIDGLDRCPDHTAFGDKEVTA